MCIMIFFFFFFQAEDGIRDLTVTGVQTCALPIGLLAAVISAQGDHQQMTQDELAETCHQELAQQGLVAESPLWMRVIAEKRATITCAPGVARPGVETGIPGVLLAGDYTDPEYPPTLEAAVRSGLRAATKILTKEI